MLEKKCAYSIAKLFFGAYKIDSDWQTVELFYSFKNKELETHAPRCGLGWKREIEFGLIGRWGSAYLLLTLRS